MAELRRVLAVASGGGHWIQLRRLRPAWKGCAVTYVTTMAGYRGEIARDAAEGAAQDGTEDVAGQRAGQGGGPPPGFFVVPDANRWQYGRLLRQLAALAWVVLKVRPHAIVTTGAAPGYFAIRLGRLIGARTVWVDSIANAEELSLSGRRAGRHADLWLTQWEHLAVPEAVPEAAPETTPEGTRDAAGPRFRGAVL